MTIGDEKKDFSREEDYRDFEQRDIENGWPYDDGAGAASHAEPYGGQTPLSSPVLPETDHRENSDQLEADIADALDNMPESLIAALDIHADGHTVTLRGAVDTAEERRMIELRVLGVKGVSTVRNFITTMGVDTHIPADSD